MFSGSVVILCSGCNFPRVHYSKKNDNAFEDSHGRILLLPLLQGPFTATFDFPGISQTFLDIYHTCASANTMCLQEK